VFASDPVGLFKVRQRARDLEQSMGCSQRFGYCRLLADFVEKVDLVLAPKSN
jgi:hypothetical protein